MDVTIGWAGMTVHCFVFASFLVLNGFWPMPKICKLTKLVVDSPLVFKHSNGKSSIYRCFPPEVLMPDCWDLRWVAQKWDSQPRANGITPKLNEVLFN